jgi:hypothetical protein
MINVRVPRLDALRHKRLPLKFPPKLDAIIRIPRWHVNRAVAWIEIDDGFTKTVIPVDPPTALSASPLAGCGREFL